MEVNEKKQMLQAILQKLFVGLIFCFGIIGFNMTLNQSTAQAKQQVYKNYSFVLVSEARLDIHVYGYKDSADGEPFTRNWNSPGHGMADFSLGKIDWRTESLNEDGTDKWAYYITMHNVNITEYTPWLVADAADSDQYTCRTFKRSMLGQDWGVTGGGSPHTSGSTERNDNGHLRTYIGMSFTDGRLDVEVGYNLGINYNGADNPQKSSYDFFTKVNSRTGTKGKIPNVYSSFGTGTTITRKGYTLDGWYCGSQKLFNADGTPVSNAYVNDTQWSDSKHTPPLYMWYGGTTITAHWTPKKYRLTLNYNNADKFPDDWGTKQATGVYYKDNFLKYDHYIGNAFGPGKVSRTGYTFNGWWICNSSGKVAQLWDANGDLIKGAKINKSYWSDGSGNYKFDGNTYVIADWVKNTTMYPLTLDYKLSDKTGISKPTEQTVWPTWFTANEGIKKIGINSSNLKCSGYEFVGWYCDTPGGEAVKLFDANGNPVKGAKYNGTQWSDSTGKYVFGKGTAVYAMRKEKLTYGLTLVYNNATKLPDAESAAAKKSGIGTWNNYFRLDGKTPGRELRGVFGKGSFYRTGYYFTGWYCGDVMLWDANGNPVANASVGGKQWSSGGRYMWDGSTTVTAHWEPMKTSLTIDWNGATEFYGAGSSLPTTWYPDFYAYNDKTHDIYGESQFAKLGYDFMGWYHGDTKVYDTDGTVVQNVWVDGQQMDKNQLFKWIDKKRVDDKTAKSDGITLTARWNPKIYGINLDDNGGSGGSGIIYEKYQNGFYFDYKCTSKTSKVKVPSRTGYTFTGYWYGAEQIIDEYGNIKATSSRFTDNVTVYAGWSAKVFKITLDNQGADKRSGTSAIYERYADGFFLEKECVNRIGAITTPQMTGYSFYGYYTDRYYIDADWSDGSKQIINENGVIGVSSTRFTSDTTIYAYWVDDIGPEEDSTYLTVTKTDDKDYVYAKATKSSVSPVSLRLSCTPGTLSQITWNTDWLNKDVSINMYGRDIGKGMKNLLIRRNDSSSWYDWQSKDFSGSKDQVSTSKNDTNESVSDFYGIATDASHRANKLETKSVTVKIDKTAPAARGIDIEDAVHTGTIYRGISSDYVPDSSRTINDDGTINEAAMRTEIKLPLKDSLSGVKFVWAIVKDDEHGTTKTYELTRRSGDDHDGTWAATPNLYEEFPAASNLTVRLYAVDVAGNLTEYKKSDGEPFKVKNFCIYTYTERGDHESPDINYYEDKDNPNPDPLFLLGQYGWVHIYTYGYVESVSVSFPGKVQKAALLDYNRLEATEGIAKADSGNKLGTIVNTRDALVTAGVPNNCNDQLGLDLRPSSTPFDVVYDATGCSRTYDYAFKVPLYLDDDYAMSGNPNKIDPARSIGFLTPTNTWCEANKYYEITEIKTIENAYKNADYEQSTASLYSGGNNPAITHKIHTHLVH